MSANRYTVLATIKAVRHIFEQNPAMPFEARWKEAKASEMFRGFQLRCKTSAKCLLAAAVPPCLVSLIIDPDTLPLNHTILIILALTYVALSIALSWRFGIMAAAKGIAQHGARKRHSV